MQVATQLSKEEASVIKGWLLLEYQVHNGIVIDEGKQGLLLSLDACELPFVFTSQRWNRLMAEIKAIRWTLKRPEMKNLLACNA